MTKTIPFMNGYKYAVSIAKESLLLTQGAFKEAVPNCREFVIASKQFGTAEECENNLNNLLMTIALANKKIDGKRYVVVKHLNPGLKTQQFTDEWPGNVLLRAYLVDVATLSAGEELDYDIDAEIQIAPITISQQSARSIH